MLNLPLCKSSLVKLDQLNLGESQDGCVMHDLVSDVLEGLEDERPPLCVLGTSISLKSAAEFGNGALYVPVVVRPLSGSRVSTLEAPVEMK